MLKQPLFWLVLGSALAITVITRNVFSDRNELYGYSEDLPEILNLVDRAYVDQVSMDKLMPGVYQGALEAVDPNASYVPPDNEPKPYWDELYQKWGLVLDRNSGFIRILAVAQGSPAETAGLLPGSYLRRIGAISTRRMNAYQVRRDLAAWDGPLPLTVIDTEHDKKLEIELKPSPFLTPKLTAKPEGGILLISLPHFYNGWETDLKQAMTESFQPGTKILLDLRNNALGSEVDLRGLASFFLGQGEIMAWKGAETAPVALANTAPGTYTNAPLFLLVDESTTWAAETFSATAQIQGQATVLGQATYGLPWGYEFIPLKNGGFLQFAKQNVALPGKSILTGTGITPDREFAKEKQVDGEEKPAPTLLDQALDYVRQAESPKRKAS